MVARQSALTASFARQLLARWGACVVLPFEDSAGNDVIIRGVFKPNRASVVDEYANKSYLEYVLLIPPDPPYGLGPEGMELAAEQVVTIWDLPRGQTCETADEDSVSAQTYYVANVHCDDLGWYVATLQEHS